MQLFNVDTLHLATFLCPRIQRFEIEYGICVVNEKIFYQICELLEPSFGGSMRLTDYPRCELEAAIKMKDLNHVKLAKIVGRSTITWFNIRKMKLNYFKHKIGSVSMQSNFFIIN
jgi:hypothetical protein